MTYLEVGAPRAARTDLCEEDAAVRAKAGDSRASEWLFSRYRSLIERLARTYFIAGADHDDVVQEGMMDLWMAICAFRKDRFRRFGPFARLCVTRQMISAVRNGIRRKHAPLNESLSLHRRLGYSEADVTFIDIFPNLSGINPEELMLAKASGTRLPERLDDL